MGQLHERMDNVEARLNQHSTTSSRPSSSNSLYKEPRCRMRSSARWRKGRGKPRDLGHRRVLYSPASVEDGRSEWCTCGSGELDLIQPYYTHQVIDLPPIELEVTRWVRPRDQYVGCGRRYKAPTPDEQATGYGPCPSALMEELTGTSGNGRRMVQTSCASGLGGSINLGAIQKVLH
jgi:transposase